ncbi:VOC family protein [Antrihabitans sp. YC2-6]|uniref:bleomycin resistance protein n=1 Tax=Antrihabitans sp. YC2-6 TaxID=2799498 RepID=UPI0018F57472|nr:VOC family protein [Antrihabitans sp. YC2-6]MBJ8343483.1 VOC family protein [Antrihabitans sp. YC2-6]
MTEKMIPILPCRSIAEILDFYVALGFEATAVQKRPNPFAAIARGTFELQFYGIGSHDPATAFNTCYVITDQVDQLYDEFRSGLRAAIGKAPSRGLPRINPIKDMSYGVRQFIVVDPSGNQIRVGQPIDGPSTPAPRTRLEKALVAATLLGDSKGDAETAARVLDGALGSEGESDLTRLRALVTRADYAIRLGAVGEGEDFLAAADAIDVDDPDSRRRIRELREELRG